MGPVFGLGATAGLAAFSWFYLRKLIGIFAGFAAFIPDQAIKVLLEGFYNDLYLSGNIDGWLTMLQLGSLCTFVGYFAWRKPK